VAVGRAVWQEATVLAGGERSAFLVDVAYQRMRRVTELCDALAKPWTTYYAPPEIAGKWYSSY
jgi:hypothetical protein